VAEKLRIREYFQYYVPIRSRKNSVEVLPTFFTIIFFRTGIFVHDADAATMLPNLAGVALQKETSQILCYICGIDQRIFNSFFYAIFVILVELWGTRIFVEAADAPNGLIVFPYLIRAIRHLYLDGLCLRGFLSFFGSTALSTCLNSVIDGDRDRALVWRFRRQRARGGGFSRRFGFVM
jgi:hypothetical protein